MNRIYLFVVFALILGCANTEYRFEQIDTEPPVVLPLKSQSLSGLRDGASVRVQAEFVNGDDAVTMNFELYLRPPVEFQSGTYRADIGGNVVSGVVECPSLIFQGGQTALPSVGGVFILKDESGRPLYRVRIPATMLTGRQLG